LVQLSNGHCRFIQSSSGALSVFSQNLTRKFNEMLSQRTSNNTRSSYNGTTGQLLQYGHNQNTIELIDLCSDRLELLQLPFAVRHIIPFGDQWLVTDPVAAASYLLNTTLLEQPTLFRLSHNLDTIGLASSAGYLNDHSLWFSTGEDYLARIVSSGVDHLIVERIKRTKFISSGDVPPQEMFVKKRLQTFLDREHSLVVSFYAKNEIDSKLM
jgi:hypothetical protein